MCNIASYVFFDIETTGLPWQERNRTKITELSFIATSRRDILNTKHGDSPPVSKLTVVYNPKRPIHPDVVRMNGLSNELLQHAPSFSQKIETILSFLQELPKPVCLVAHNGYRFDFKILLAECNDAKVSLPNYLLCVDSLAGFRTILTKKVCHDDIIDHNITIDSKVEDLITDDEDDWPVLNVSTEEWEDIDKICDSLSDISVEDIADGENNSFKRDTKKKISRNKVISNVFKKGDRNIKGKNKESFTLLALYRRLLNREPSNHHRAEEDCMMLLQCVVATKQDFIPWADSACVKLDEITPLIRH